MNGKLVSRNTTYGFSPVEMKLEGGYTNKGV